MRLQFIIENRDLVDRFNRAIEKQGDNVNTLIESFMEEYVEDNPICEGCNGVGFVDLPNYSDMDVDASDYKQSRCDECN